MTRKHNHYLNYVFFFLGNFYRVFRHNPVCACVRCMRLKPDVHEFHFFVLVIFFLKLCLKILFSVSSMSLLKVFLPVGM